MLGCLSFNLYACYLYCFFIFSKSCNTRYISLGDGRSLCLECTESAIADTGDCQQLYHAIRDFYEGMNMAIDQQVPMLLVERQALNEAIEGEKHVRMISTCFFSVLQSANIYDWNFF